MKRNQLLMIAVLMVVVLAGCQATAQSDLIVDDKPEPREKMIEAFGVIRCRESLNILVDVPLTVNSVSVREGQVVQKGEALAAVAMDELKSQIALKKLQLTGEKDALAFMNEEINRKKETLALSQDPDALKLKHDLVNAQLNLDKMVVELEGKKKLVAAGSMTQNEVDNFQKGIDAAQKNIDDIQFALDSLDYGRKLEVEQLENQTTGRKNNIELLQLELDQLADKKKNDYISDGNVICTLERAIVDGIYTAVGDMVAPGTKLFSLIDLNTKYVEARIPEEFIKDVKVGMEARIIPLADKSLSYTGTVVNIAQKATQGNGETNVLVEIDVKDEEGFLIPDFNVNVEIR